MLFYNEQTSYRLQTITEKNTKRRKRTVNHQQALQLFLYSGFEPGWMSSEVKALSFLCNFEPHIHKFV